MYSKVYFCFLLTNISIAVEEKCTWNLIKSNCKFQKMTDKLGYTVKKGVNKITKPLKPITNSVKTKTKKWTL